MLVGIGTLPERVGKLRDRSIINTKTNRAPVAPRKEQRVEFHRMVNVKWIAHQRARDVSFVASFTANVAWNR